MNIRTALRKLYLLQPTTTTVPLPQGRSMEMVLPSYLVVTADNKRILIDTGMATDARPSGAPPAQNEKNVIEHLSEVELRPCDINTLICTHFDVDHCGFHDSFSKAVFMIQSEHYELAHSATQQE